MKPDFYDKLIAGLEIMRHNHPTGEFSIEDERIYIEPTGLTVFEHEEMIRNGWEWAAGPGTYMLDTADYHE